MDRTETFVDQKKEINVDGKKTGNARIGNARTGKNEKVTKNAKAESNVDGKKTDKPCLKEASSRVTSNNWKILWMGRRPAMPGLAGMGRRMMIP
ncbi:hypothetical protein ACP4OV_008943 [Aristida adscensionis]